MLLLSADDVQEWLRHYRFEPNLIFSEGEVTAELPQLGLLGFGASIDEALDDLLAEIRAYTQRFFERSSLYMQSARRDQWPLLLRFALTDPEEQRRLLAEPPLPAGS